MKIKKLKFKNPKSKFFNRRSKIIFALIAVLAIAGGFGAARLISDRAEKSCFEPGLPGAGNQPASDSNDYFPLAADNEWRYKIRLGSETGSDLIFRVAGQESIDGGLAYAVRNEHLDSDEYYGETPEGVFYYRANGNDVNPPRPVLPFPLAAGETRDWEGAVGDIEFSGTLSVLKEETITVPAGSFKAWRIEIESRSQNYLISKTTRWFAGGVGMIKEKGVNFLEDGEIKFCAELAEYHLK